MKFDVIISNPPYNNDMYLDFVKAGYDLLKPDGQAVFITPAKWYAKGGKKNEDFRKTIVPHMKEIHVYKCCTDVFDIADRGGISYYSVFKNKIFDTKLVQQHSRTPNGKALVLKTDLEEHTEQPLELIGLAALSIINKCKQVARGQALFEGFTVQKNYYCHDTTSGHSKKFDDDVELMSGVGNALTSQGYLSRTELRTTDNIDKYKALINEMMMSGKGLQLDKNAQTTGVVTSQYIKPGQVNKGSYCILYLADTQLEVESFLSYFNSKLIGFIAAQSPITNNSCSDKNWRHVPALPAGYSFDHIYTNEEIFKIFELTDDEIRLITNLIKDRKQK